ncbi:hypothetical protein [Actinomadura sp. 6N118]|uniref:hypothetical protein n=1 Tax=Actinomadura sp. 6N118 TaxID=3375151 RepID=UPI0037A15338
MRIPKRLDASLDWVARHLGTAGVVVVLAAATASVTWHPPLAAFILGTGLGVLLVHLRTAKRLTRARSEVNDLLRENGKLRHRNTVLTSGVIARGSQMTQKFVAIPDEVDPAVDPQRTLPLPDAVESGASGPAGSDPVRD